MKMNTASSSGSGTLPSNTITNPKEDLKGITTRSGTAYQRPTIPTTSSSLPKVVERETKGVALKIKGNVTSFRPTKDRIFKDCAGSKRKHEDQSRNWGRNDKDKRQRTGIKFSATTSGQGQVQKQYVGQFSKAANDRPRQACFECRNPNHFRNNFLRLNRVPNQGNQNCPNPVLATKENQNQRNNGN
nr:reverse transcriptase domain-containing protein [Tanacetum cinerariifolium]